MGTYTLQYTGQEVDEIFGSTEELSTRVTELDEDLSSRMADLEGALDSIPESSHIAGIVYPFAGEGNPEGFLLCDGSAYSRTEYAKLFAAIGTTYGAGDGSSTFNLPNIESRTIIGEGTGASGTEYALGTTGGEEKHAQTVDELASHRHHSTGATNALHAAGNDDGYLVTGNYTNHGNYYMSYEGGGQPFNVMQPYIVMRYFISTGEGGVISGGSSGTAIGHFDNATVENDLEVGRALTVNGREYGVNKVLWSGSVYPESAVTITLSEAVSAQPNGIVLLFQEFDYSNTVTLQNSGLHTYYVPKEVVARFPGTGHSITWAHHSGVNFFIQKYLYINDTTIIGNDYNWSGETMQNTSSVRFSNASSMLTYVIGV